MAKPDKVVPLAPRPIIRIRGGELHEVASEAEKALGRFGAPLYVRSGEIVKPVIDSVEAAKGRKTKVGRLQRVTGAGLVDYLSRAASWERYDKRSKRWSATDPPKQVAEIILSRDGEWEFPVLSGVIGCPTMRRDGSIINQVGYDRKAQLLLIDSPEMGSIPLRPSRSDAEDALALLDGLLNGFPFVDAASRSVALSALMTPVLRPGALTSAPLHVMRAPSAGSGKSYLVDLAAAISTGQFAPVIAIGRTDEETEKRLGAALLGGQPIISLDNVNGRLGGDALCQVVERPVVQVRPLQRSELKRIESRATVFATGNNVEIEGDLVRRALLCSLDADQERPELRRFENDPLAAVLADRGKFIAAIFTIARAYIAAACPEVCPPLASFEDWSRVIRSSIVWLGRVDAADTMEIARAEDTSLTAMRALFAAWYEAASSDAKLTREIRDVAESRTGEARCHPDLHRVLVDIAPARGGGIETKLLGQWLKRHQNRVADGLKLTSEIDSHSKQRRWRVLPKF